MSNEIRVTSNLYINKSPLQYQSQPTTFTADMTGCKGPTPGALAVDLDGVAVDLSQLTTPGMCRLMNLDDTNLLIWGIFDTDTSVFYPVGDIGAGETYVIRLSQFFGYEMAVGTGTGTAGSNIKLYLKADGAALSALVEVFEA